MSDKPIFDPGAHKVTHIKQEPTVKPGAKFDPQAFLAKKKEVAETKEEKQKIILKELNERPLGKIKAWSFSTLMKFEECPYGLYLSKVEKCPNPSGPAADRGSKIHQAAEDFIQGVRPDVAKELKHFDGLIREIRDLYGEGKVEVEQDWGFTRDWRQTGWMDADTWARVKLDVLIHEDPTSVICYDWKSGQKFGNEIKHSQQCISYALATVLRYPEVQFVEAAMLYVDKDDKMVKRYTRDELLGIHWKGWERRANLMTTAVDFPAYPSKHNCKWCPHAKVQEGFEEPACQHRYTD